MLSPIQRKYASRIKVIALYGIILLSFIPFIDENLYLIYGVPLQAKLNNPDAEMRPLVHVYESPRDLSPEQQAVYNNRPWRKISGLGRRVGLITYWKMFSPFWRQALRVELYARDPKGEFVEVPIPNLSLEYREQRSFMDAIYWDFKRGSVLAGLYLDRTGADRRAYAEYHCRRLEKELGYHPEAMRIIVRQAPIPTVYEYDNWNPLRISYPFERINETYECHHVQAD